MNKIIIYIIISILSLSLIGCSKKEERLGDIYLVGQDSSAFMFQGDLKTTFITKSEEGYYLLLNGYVYYVDQESMQPVALCNKPNCLHDKETKEELRVECNAYVGDINGMKRWIQYEKGNLYLFDAVGKDKTIAPKFIRLSADGSQREEVSGYTSTENPIVVHRGCAYYSRDSYTSEEEGEVSGTYCIVRLPLEKKDAKEEVIYSGNLEKGMINLVKAYGRYVYFYESGYQGDYDWETMRGYEERMFAYNIETGEQTEIGNPDRTDCIMDYIAVDQGKLLYWYWYYSYEDIRNGQLFYSDLDGKNEQEIVDTQNAKNYIGTDGNYYYSDNCLEKDLTERKIKIFDRQGKELNEISIENLEKQIISYGDERYLFYTTVNGDSRGIYYIDKQEIGTESIEPKLLIETKFLDEY